MAEGSEPVIPRFYAGRDIFITGASGFMGKVVVERLLSTCPDVGRVFLLLRSKRGLSPDARLSQLKDNTVFDAVRERSPGQLDKLRLVAGDVSQPRLGLSDQSIADLKQVSVVLNCAATVRFHEPLRRALDQNTRSAARVMDLADTLHHVAAFVHVSTVYSNSEHDEIEERVYTQPHAADHARALPDNAAPELVQRFISPKENTYTFTKALAESVVAEREAAYPRAIFRPSIVISALKHPSPGWVEGYNGPCGPVHAIAQGLLRVMPVAGGACADLLPVDCAAGALLAVAWDVATLKSPTALVYNCSTSENPTTWEELRQHTLLNARRYPPPDLFWYPTCVYVQNRLFYKLLVFLLQTLPMHLAEYLMRIINPKKKVGLIGVARHLRAAEGAWRAFSGRGWRVAARRLSALRAAVGATDAALYQLDPNDIDWAECYRSFVVGCRRHLGRHSDASLPRARTRLRRMYVVHRVVAVAVPLLLLSLLLARTAHYWTYLIK